jgi:hypothetical protein
MLPGLRGSQQQRLVLPLRSISIILKGMGQNSFRSGKRFIADLKMEYLTESADLAANRRRGWNNPLIPDPFASYLSME